MNECIPVGNIACGKDVLGVVDSARQDDDEDEAVVPDLVAAELAELQQYGVQVHGPGHRSGWVESREDDTRLPAPAGVCEWRAALAAGIARPLPRSAGSRVAALTRRYRRRLSTHRV